MTQGDLEYARGPGVRYWRLALGGGFVALAAVLTLVSKYGVQAYVRTAMPTGRTAVLVVIQVMPLMLATGLVAVAGWLLSGVTQRTGAVRSFLALSVLGLWVCSRMVTDLLTLIDLRTPQPPGTGPACYVIVAATLAMGLVVAGLYFIRLGGLLGRRGLGFLAAGLLVPCVGISLCGVLYQWMRLMAAVYDPGVQTTAFFRTLRTVYTPLYDVSFSLMILTFGSVAVFGMVQAARQRR